MNNLQLAANLISTSWCQGAYHNHRDNTFCSVGALAEVTGMSEMDVEMKSQELIVLASVIMENYPDGDWENRPPDEVVIDFNDSIAESKEEVVAMFEKAAVRWDEK